MGATLAQLGSGGVPNDKKPKRCVSNLANTFCKICNIFRSAPIHIPEADSNIWAGVHQCL